MKLRAAIATSLLLLAASACKKDDKKDGPSSGPAKVDEPTPAVVVADAAPAKAAYSADEGKKQIAAMSSCAYDFDCEAYKALAGHGAAAGPELLAAVGDASLSLKHRALIAKLIGAAKVPDAGPTLIEIGNGITDDEFMVQGDFYEAAGQAGGQATFDLLIAEYMKAAKSTDDNRDIPLRKGLRGFPAETVAWAKAALPKADREAVDIADLLDDSATEADKPALVEALGATKDVMARNRIAKKLIELGDNAHFGVFVEGLQSKDVYDRSDSANFLADVADRAPAELHAQLIDLLEKGKAGDQGGLTAAGYDEALKKLGAQ